MVVFGDNLNDLSMFQVADERYAVANAVQELKEIATGVIESNDNDGVARWLKENRYENQNRISGGKMTATLYHTQRMLPLNMLRCPSQSVYTIQ